MNKVDKLIENLRACNFEARYFKTSQEAKECILNTVGSGKMVGFGGSMTIYEMGIHQELQAAGNEIYWHWLVEPEHRRKAIEQAARADFYLSSANAITLDGEIVNIDGTGNRVASMIFGPKKAIIVCGVNKICDDLTSAFTRIRKEACPRNAQRLKRKTPCGLAGKCTDCNSPDRMCNVSTVLHRKPAGIDIEVSIVGEELGY